MMYVLVVNELLSTLILMILVSYQISCFGGEIGRFGVVVDGIVVVELAMTTKESSLKWR